MSAAGIAIPIIIAGPTASGKSAVATRLAEVLNGEVISADSMQVYRGLDIGTAKPSAADCQRVPHHLVDIANLNEEFDAAQFAAKAGVAVAEIQARGRRVIFCGGTGFYLKAWQEGLVAAASRDPALRATLEAAPLADLLAELERADPVAFARIDRQNPRRVVRALEVIRLTGKPYSQQRADWGGPPATLTPARWFGLARSSADLRQRIETRVEEMFARGLVEETRLLLPQGLEQNRTAMQAIGYRQVVEHLRGERTLAETIALVKTRTWQYARRQMTWFRRQAPVTWIACQPAQSAEEIAEEIPGHIDFS
jgi:tRNA dimethylallyltransferase